MTEQAILDRVRKLLALADPDRNPNAEEVQAALTKARQIMAEHGLEEAQVLRTEAGRPSDETVVEAVVGGGVGDYEVWEGWFAVVIAEAFRCQSYRTRTKWGVEIRIFGRPTDVQVAREAILVMKIAASALCDRWVERTGRNTRRDRLGYYNGFVSGIKRAIDDQTRAHPEWALVLATPAVVRRYATEVLHLRAGRATPVNMSDAGRQQGWRDGYDTWTRNVITE